MSNNNNSKTAPAKCKFIEEFENGISESFLLIEINKKYLPLKRGVVNLIKKFLVYLIHVIRIDTPLNYHQCGLYKNSIKILPHINTTDKMNMITYDILESKMETLLTAFHNLDFSKAKRDTKWLIRSLRRLGYNISDLFTVAIFTDTNAREANLLIENNPDTDRHTFSKTPPHMSTSTISSQLRVPTKVIALTYPDNIVEPEIKRVRLADNSTITYISDPYILDYGVFHNLTTTFDEYNFAYNMLHVYEHIMCLSWDALSKEDMVKCNGATYPNAIAYVFTIHTSLKSYKMYLISDLLHRIKSRKQSFWDKPEMNRLFQREIERTISETRNERSLAIFGRSDCTAFDFEYNKEVFTYWSRKPFDMLCIGPAPLNELMIRHDKINKEIQSHPRYDKSQKIPKWRHFDRLPLEPLRMREHFMPYVVMKLDKGTIKQILSTNRRSEDTGKDLAANKKRTLMDLYEGGRIGYDNCVIWKDYIDNDKPIPRSETTILQPLLFCNRLFGDTEIKEIFDKIIFPVRLTNMEDKKIDVFDLELNELDLI